ncbi:MAG: hypothetical protein ACOYVF_07465 [Candidatus Zixiibacteriota bacterium]
MCFFDRHKHNLSLPALFILFSLIGYLLAGTIALHLHVLPDGRIVIHNHTSSGNAGPDKSHSHSDRDYQFISHITSLLNKSTLAAVSVIYIYFVFVYYTTSLVVPVTARISPILLPVRAPPALSA